MKCKLSMSLVMFILNFHIVNEAYEITIKNVIELTSDVQKLYKFQSVAIVYDKQIIEWSLHRTLLGFVKEFSGEYLMSQAVNFNNLELMVQLKGGYDEQRGHPTATLVTLLVDSQENLERFQKFAKTEYVSAYSWLLIFGKDVGFDCENPKGNPLNLDIDTRMMVKCANDKSIKKYYSIFENVTEVLDLAVWRADGSLRAVNDDLWQVEEDRKGSTLRIAQHSESSNLVNKNKAKYLNSLLKELKDMGQFKSKVVAEEDLIGFYNFERNSWVGLMGIMLENKADIGLTFMTLSSERLEGADFPMPLWRVTKEIYVKMPDSTTIQWTAYFQVFDTYTWSTIGIVILIFSVLLGTIKRKFWKFSIDGNTFFENLIGVLGIYSQQGLSERPSSTSIQILCFSMLFSSYILYNIYSAVITSYIALLETSLPFSTYDEFLQFGYTIIVQRGSRNEDLIRRNDSLLVPLRPFLLNHDDLPTNAYDGFKQVCERRVAFYSNGVSYYGTNRNFSCTIGSIKLPRIEYLGLALAKNSPYTKIINYYILRFLDNGMLARLRREFFYRLKEVNVAKPITISLSEVIPILSIWILGVIFSLFILCIEFILIYQKERRLLSKKKIKRLAW